MYRANFILALLVSAFTCTAAVAGTTSELKVTGKINPPACRPTLDGGGDVNYGVIMANSLVRGESKRLDSRRVALSISCESPARMSFKLTDNRAASRVPAVMGRLPDIYNYGLGTVSGANVGGFSLMMEDATVADGPPASNLYSVNGGSNWYGHVRTTFLSHNGHLFSFGDAQHKPVAFTQLNATIRVTAVLNKPENLPLSQEVPIDGSATIEMTYL